MSKKPTLPARLYVTPTPDIKLNMGLHSVLFARDAAGHDWIPLEPFCRYWGLPTADVLAHCHARLKPVLVQLASSDFAVELPCLSQQDFLALFCNHSLPFTIPRNRRRQYNDFLSDLTTLLFTLKDEAVSISDSMHKRLHDPDKLRALFARRISQLPISSIARDKPRN